MSINSNVPRYAGYKVDNLPKRPEVAVYLCRGKLQKWIPHKWICIDAPSRFQFDDLETGKSNIIGSKSKDSCHKSCYEPPHKSCCDFSCTSCNSSSNDCDSCGESIVRCFNIPGCEIIIRIPIVGNCPVISDFSEIFPISIEDGFFVLDVSSLCCGGCLVLTYKSCVCGSPVTVNQIIQRPCVVRTICPTIC